MAQVSLRDVRKSYAGLEVIHGVSCEIADGELIVIVGPSGSGKSLICLQFIRETIRNGGKAAMFIFDEEMGLLLDRAKPLGFDLAAMRDCGKLSITQLDAAELLRSIRGMVAGGTAPAVAPRAAATPVAAAPATASAPAAAAAGDRDGHYHKA